MFFGTGAGLKVNINNAQNLSVRYFHDAGVQATGTSPINPLYNSASNQPSYQWSVQHTWIATPTVVNTFNASVLPQMGLLGTDGHRWAQMNIEETKPVLISTG